MHAAPASASKDAVDDQSSVEAGGTTVSRSPRWRSIAPGLGVFTAFVLTVVIFVSLRPRVFTSVDTWLGIIEQSAVPIIIAAGLTVALIVGDFDLSIGAVFGLSMGVAISLMANSGAPWLLAALIALVAAALVGVVNGILVTRLGVNSFIGTLAMGSVVGGLEARVTDQATISNGIPADFIAFGRWSLLGLNSALWIALILVAVLFVFTRQTESGRYLYAIGSNAEAARLAGVKVRTLRVTGFIVAATSAGLAGILLASQSASYYPNAGTGYLLPAYAAAFLGTALAAGRFGILATVFGVIFLQTLQTGLTVLNVESWVVLVTQGLVLIIAVMLSGASNAFRGPRRLFTRRAR